MGLTSVFALFNETQVSQVKIYRKLALKGR